jgi:hypothetical protein
VTRARTVQAADSTEIDDALVARLLSDATLKSLLPDGVWWDVAGKDSEQFVVVTLVDHVDVPVFGRRGAESFLYLVKAVVLNRSGGDIKAAAKRIDQLLDDQPLTVPPEYGFAAMYRERRIRLTEVDTENAAIRWLHRGGHYRVQVGVA